MMHTTATKYCPIHAYQACDGSTGCSCSYDSAYYHTYEKAPEIIAPRVTKLHKQLRKQAWRDADRKHRKVK
jgi:hypothetical protein